MVTAELVHYVVGYMVLLVWLVGGKMPFAVKPAELGLEGLRKLVEHSNTHSIEVGCTIEMQNVFGSDLLIEDTEEDSSRSNRRPVAVVVAAAIVDLAVPVEKENGQIVVYKDRSRAVGQRHDNIAHRSRQEHLHHLEIVVYAAVVAGTQPRLKADPLGTAVDCEEMAEPLVVAAVAEDIPVKIVAY